jgi:hypothetical protein
MIVAYANSASGQLEYGVSLPTALAPWQKSVGDTWTQKVFPA